MNLKTLKHPSTYAKAIIGGLTAGLGALGTALADERITSVEWTIVALAVLGAFATVFGVGNKSVVPPDDQDPLESRHRLIHKEGRHRAAAPTDPDPLGG